MAKLLLAVGSLSLLFASSAYGQEIAIDCIDTVESSARLDTNSLLKLLASHSENWNPEDAVSVGGVGAMNRLFNGSGRLVHPKELAEAIRSSGAFQGEKRHLVRLAVSDSSLGEKNSYVSQLSKLLDTKVQGCESDSYLISNGIHICSGIDEASSRSIENSTRHLPVGIHLDSIFMVFCNNKNSRPDPRSILSASQAFGLFPLELKALEASAHSDGNAAFRFYQYYWISRRDKSKALEWLEISANSGSKVAQYNFAYEIYSGHLYGDALLADKWLKLSKKDGPPTPELDLFFGKKND